MHYARNGVNLSGFTFNTTAHNYVFRLSFLSSGMRNSKLKSLWHAGSTEIALSSLLSIKHQKFHLGHPVDQISYIVPKIYYSIPFTSSLRLQASFSVRGISQVSAYNFFNIRFGAFVVLHHSIAKITAEVSKDPKWLQR